MEIKSHDVKKPRKKTNYKKINNQTREKLIGLVYLKDFMLKDAAKVLDINYSTAKTILRVFRKEKRVDKKNSKKQDDLFENDHKTEESISGTEDKLLSNNFPKEGDEAKQMLEFTSNLENIHKFIGSNIENIMNTQHVINFIFKDMNRLHCEITEHSKNNICSFNAQL